MGIRCQLESDVNLRQPKKHGDVCLSCIVLFQLGKLLLFTTTLLLCPGVVCTTQKHVLLALSDVRRDSCNCKMICQQTCFTKIYLFVCTWNNLKAWVARDVACWRNAQVITKLQKMFNHVALFCIKPALSLKIQSCNHFVCLIF